MLSSAQAVEQVQILRSSHDAERSQLNQIRRYWKGRQPLPTIIPQDSPDQVKRMARIARVNICPIIIDALAQSTFVDGFRGQGIPESVERQLDDPIWKAWQANKMDARQTGLHRAAFAYRAAYTIVLPGDPYPVIRTLSPRQLTAVYGEDPDWPMWALERAGDGLWKLYDEQAVYFVSEETKNINGLSERVFTFVETREYDGDTGGVVPVIRYLDEDDLDADDEVDDMSGASDQSGANRPTGGQIAPMMSLQDQIDLTTFGLLVAQWYAAFKQRYVIGWVPGSEREALRMGASRLMYFEDPANDSGAGSGDGVKVGEFAQTDLGDYLESREALLKYAATLSQTPVHELVGDLVNLSAEALAAAEAGHERKVDERKTLLGESHEQTLRLVGRLMNQEVADDAEVVWRDTSARTFAATVDGLGKLAVMLGVPAQELWTRIPGVTQQDVERWKSAAEQGGAFAQLQALLEKQAGGGGGAAA